MLLEPRLVYRPVQYEICLKSAEHAVIEIISTMPIGQIH